MRLASGYEILRSELQASQQEAANLHIENVRLKTQLAALSWTPITEQNLPTRGHEVLNPEGGCRVSVVRCEWYENAVTAKEWHDAGWTHFRPLTPPDLAGERP